MRFFAISLSFFLILASFAPVVQAQHFVTPCPVGQVKIESGIFKDNELLDRKVLSTLDADRLLYAFHVTAGLPNANGLHQYGGWESTDLRGHSLGHYLTALSYDYALTGSDSVKQLIGHVVSELARCQQALGNGYVSAFPETMLDVADATGNGWAPYYTLHKILQGLLDAYTFTGNREALEIASRFGDYIYGRTTRITNPAQWVKVLDIMEVGGFAEGMLNLYHLTGKQEHLEAGVFFQQMDKLEPAAAHKDILNDSRTDNFRHVNATIPQFIAAVRQYQLTGDKLCLDAATYFWNEVTQHRCYTNGSTGRGEHWYMGPDSLTHELMFNAGESCSTYNLIRLAQLLFSIAPQACYADYVEGALLNHILGSIDPETGDMMYFHTQSQGSFKTYGQVDKVFWCCSGTGMENHVRYGENIYSQDGNSLYVNQFIPSTLNWQERGLTIEQSTSFPMQGVTRLKVTSGQGTIQWNIRVPAWCKSGFALKVNGKRATGKRLENGYCLLAGEWKAGDVIEVTLPMTLWINHDKGNPRMGSLMYGPLVLAADMGTQGVTEALIHPEDYFYEQQPAVYAPSFAIPSLTGSTTHLSWLKQVKGKGLTFETRATSTGEKLRFAPLYSFHDRRFVSYWSLEGSK